MTNINKTPSTFEEAIQQQAQFLIDIFSVDNSPIEGEKLDFTKSSLLLVDLILRDYYLEQEVLPDDLHLVTSCYVFETLRQCFGGRYTASETPNDIVLVLGEPEFRLECLVMERIWACAKNWEANRLILFYEIVEEQIRQKNSIQLGTISD